MTWMMLLDRVLAAKRARRALSVGLIGNTAQVLPELLRRGVEVDVFTDQTSAPAADERVDVEGRCTLPEWVDSHTYLVFAGDRIEEFRNRMSGQPYHAGGIAATVEATRAASDAELVANLRKHADEAVAQGTTSLETKTGYGLDVEQEGRCARIAAEVADEVTFLGAHLVPPESAPSPTWISSVARCSKLLPDMCSGETSSVKQGRPTRNSPTGF